MARALAFSATIAVSLLAVSGAGGSGTQTPRAGGTVVFGELTRALLPQPTARALLRTGRGARPST